jgi:hypothetical protein
MRRPSLPGIERQLDSRRAQGGNHFRRILANGWHRSAPKGQGTYFGPTGRCSVTDHLICNDGLTFADARYVTEGCLAVSDHAAVLARMQRE